MTFREADDSGGYKRRPYYSPAYADERSIAQATQEMLNDTHNNALLQPDAVMGGQLCYRVDGRSSRRTIPCKTLG